MLNRLINAIIYRRCFTCKHPAHSPICSFCETQLPWLREALCHQCAIPLLDNSGNRCGQCIQHNPHYDFSIAAFRYDYPIQQLIHQFKFDNCWRLARFLGVYMADAIKEQWDHLPSQPDCLVAVPMHSKRLKGRGYNQAMLLARCMAKQLGLTTKRYCQKDNHTTPQASLNRKKRQASSPRFSMRFPLNPLHRHIMLIDDVMTTGSTLNSLARCLKQAGASMVSVCCLARTCQAARIYHKLL